MNAHAHLSWATDSRWLCQRSTLMPMREVMGARSAAASSARSKVRPSPQMRASCDNHILRQPFMSAAATIDGKSHARCAHLYRRSEHDADDHRLLADTNRPWCCPLLT